MDKPARSKRRVSRRLARRASEERKPSIDIAATDAAPKGVRLLIAVCSWASLMSASLEPRRLKEVAGAYR